MNGKQKKLSATVLAGCTVATIAAFALAGPRQDREQPRGVLTIAMRQLHPGASRAVGEQSPPEFNSESISAEAMARRGSVEVDGKTYNLYLPVAASYTARNTSKDTDENNSSVVLVDQNRNGRLTRDECRHASLPLRVGDRMFRVVHLARDGSMLQLAPAAVPVESLVVGRSCPSFSYQTLDGKTVDLKSYRGKALILDVWSYT